MRIAYFHETFPDPGETFVLREIQELERQGVEVHNFALHRPQAVWDATQEAYQRKTRYAPSLTDLSFWSFYLQSTLTDWPEISQNFADHAQQSLRNPLAMLSFPYFDAFARVVARKIKTRRLERVHAHFAHISALTGLLAARLAGVKFSFSAHAQDVFASSPLFPPFLPWKAAAADLILTCNQAARNRLAHVLPPTSHYKVQLVHHGVDLSVLASGTKARPKTEPPVILAVGRLVPKKGVDILLRAIRQLQQGGQLFSVQIVGDGPLQQQLKSLRDAIGLTDRQVRFLGARPFAEVAQLMQQATVFALASRQTEDGDQDGIPNVLLEAAALRLPIVSTQTGSIPELIQHEKTGLLAASEAPEEFARHLDKLLQDKHLGEQLSQAAYQDVAQHYSLKSNVEAIKALFENPPLPV